GRSRDGETREDNGSEEGAHLEGLQESEEIVARRLGQICEACLRRLRLTAVPEDRLGEIARAPIVQEQRVAGDGFGQSDAPQRRRAPLIAVGGALVAVIGEA